MFYLNEFNGDFLNFIDAKFAAGVTQVSLSLSIQQITRGW